MTTKQILNQFRNRLESIPALQDCSERDLMAALRGLLEFLPALREITAEPTGGWVVIDRDQDIVCGPTTEREARDYRDAANCGAVRRPGDLNPPLAVVNYLATAIAIFPTATAIFPQDLDEMPFIKVTPSHE